MTALTGGMTMGKRKGRPSRPVPLLGVELGTREVEDPYDGGRITVTVNLKESPLDRWRSHGDIDGAQYAAGDRFRYLWERSELGGAQALDPAKDYVDGGVMPDPYSLERMRAGVQLRAAKLELGDRDYKLVCLVIGERKFCSEMFPANRWEADYHSRRVRDALTDLAKMWGMIAEGRRCR